MTTWSVMPSGGDYTTLASALSNANTVAGDIIEISGDWTSITDNSAATVQDDNITIRAIGGAKHDGYDNGGSNYELAVSSGHALTVNNTGCVLEGFIIQQAGTGNSNEGIRMAASGGTLTCRNMIIWAGTQSTSQDGVYCGNLSCTIILEQTVIFGFYRGAVFAQSFSSGAPTVVIEANSCGFWNNGYNMSSSFGSQGGGIVFSGNGGSGASFTANVHNTWSLDNLNGNALYNGDYHQAGSSGTFTWGISYSIDSDGSIASRDPGGVGNLANRTIREATAGGDEVLVQNKSSTPYDLRLVNDATNNDAQDAHAVATAEGLTIPSTDIAGTTRPQNTNYDIGFFEVVAGAPPSGKIPVFQRTYRNMRAA